MKQTRRGFLGAFAAIAAAVAVAPQAQAEVAPRTDFLPSELWFSDAAIEHGDGPTGWYMDADGTRHLIVDGVEVERAIAEARAEGYERGRAVESAKAESHLSAAATPASTSPSRSTARRATCRPGPDLTC